MTTILMQSNATSVLVIEQTISLATDSGSSVWVERYNGVSSYDAMLEELMDGEGMSVSQAESELDAEYGEAAKAIAAKIPDYLDALKPYTESGIDLASSETDIVNYFKDKDASAQVAWYSAAAQYVLLSNALDSDGISFIETITDETCDLAGEDNYMLYPFVSVLTEGQIACLDFLTLYQLVSLGINDDQTIGDAMKKIELDTGSELTISIYSGIDRAIFSENVAMTTDANSLQQSTGKDMTTNWFRDGISPSTVVIYISLGVSLAATIGCFVTSSVLATLAKSHTVVVENASTNALTSINALTKELYSHPEDLSLLQKFEGLEENSVVENLGYVTNRSKEVGGYTRWSNVFKYVGIAMACVTVILLGVSLWRTIADLKAFYNAEYTPVPMYIVHQGVNENDEKVYTYYKAVACNRADAGMINDRTAVLEDTGDINGDVGLQWVALYTTTDKSAGQPITADFAVQYANSNIPGGRTALSLFGEKSAQNLTNERNGFTYSDSKDGIYLFYGTDSGVFSGSAISGGVFALIAGAAVLVIVAAYFIISRKSRKGEKAQ
ncbi:MAG: hypothetical protein HUJ65_00280 [Oscillospiraceae bacterium]|nr:hypothetical protein [Oscillospiraceae bacterium]